MIMDSHIRYLRTYLVHTSELMAGARKDAVKEMRVQLETDLMNFLFHLDMRGVDIDVRKRTLIADLFDCEFTDKFWKQYAQAHGVFYSSFGTQVPRSFSILLQIENACVGKGGESCTKSFVEILDWLSRLTHSSLREVMQIANRRNAYLNMLCNTASKQLKTPWKSRVLASRQNEDKIDAGMFFGLEIEGSVRRSLQESIESIADSFKPDFEGRSVSRQEYLEAKRQIESIAFSSADLRTAVRQICTRLAAADGPINAAEAYAIREYFKTNVESLYLSHIVQKENAGALPSALVKVLQGIRNVADSAPDAAEEVAHVLLEFYDTIVPLILEIDGDINSKEEKAYAELRQRMVDYLEADLPDDARAEVAAPPSPESLDMLAAFESMCSANGYKLHPAARVRAGGVLQLRAASGAGAARSCLVRQLFGQVVSCQSSRLLGMKNPTPWQQVEILPEDIS